MTKAAVRALARTLTLELAPRRIRVNVLTPGPIETPAFRRAGLSDQDIAEMKADLKTLIPLGRVGRPDEMAAVALFLASEDASFIAGAEIAADGGMAQV